MNDADKKAFEAWFKWSKIKLGADIKEYQMGAWSAACEWRDNQSAEPVAYQYRFSNPYKPGDFFWHNKPRWNGQNPVESRALFINSIPPAAEYMEIIKAAKSLKHASGTFEISNGLKLMLDALEKYESIESKVKEDEK